MEKSSVKEKDQHGNIKDLSFDTTLVFHNSVVILFILIWGFELNPFLLFVCRREVM